MAEFNIRTDSVDVEQIMRQIRARIKEKRGVDYTEQQIQDLANVKLERFLDPKGVRSDLVEQFKRTRGVSPEPPNYGFEDTTLYETHRGIVRFIRKLLNPVLKMFFNPNPIVHVLHVQGDINNINAQQFRVREELDGLYYEVIHNLVLEVTRLGIESKNLKMRLESLSSRMDFDERRARALEGAVQYKAGTGPAREPHAPSAKGYQPAPPKPLVEALGSQPAYPSQPPRSEHAATRSFTDAAPLPASQGTTDAATGGGSSQQPAAGTADAATGTARRRRRRRRGRRGGRGRGPGEESTSMASTPPHGDPTAAAAFGPAGDQPGASGPEADSGDEEGPEPSEQ